MRLIPIILYGGTESRLWSVSFELSTKLNIHLGDGESLLQKLFPGGLLLLQSSKYLRFESADVRDTGVA